MAWVIIIHVSAVSPSCRHQTGWKPRYSEYGWIAICWSCSVKCPQHDARFFCVNCGGNSIGSSKSNLTCFSPYYYINEQIISLANRIFGSNIWERADVLNYLNSLLDKWKANQLTNEYKNKIKLTILGYAVASTTFFGFLGVYLVNSLVKDFEA
jgi:predicted RNA-binding Zn-ribbon protein involved in translation (DUF1610 family)